MLASKFTNTAYYLIALSIIAFVALIGQLGIQFVTDTYQQQESAITVSNQQRILSQRLAFYCMYLVGDSPDKINDDIRETIKQLKRQMLTQHLALQHGDTTLRLSALNDEEVQTLFDKSPNRLNDKITQYFAAIDNLLSTPDSELRWNHPSLVLIADDAEDGYLLSSLDKITLGFKAQQQRQMIFQQKVQWAAFVSILVTIGLVARLIFYPMLVAIEQKERLLKERNQKLLIMCKRMVKPVRKQRRKEEKEKKKNPLLLPQPKRKRLYYTSVPDFDD